MLSHSQPRGRYSRLFLSFLFFTFCCLNLMNCSPPEGDPDGGSKCKNSRDCSELQADMCKGGKCLCKSGKCTLKVNDPPEADAGKDQTVRLGQKVFLNGNNSFDKNGDPITFKWKINSAPDGSVATLDADDKAQVSFTPDKDGTYVVELEVSDSQSKATDSVTIKVNRGANTAPTAKVGEDRTVAIGETVQLDGSGSSDPENDKLVYTWKLEAPADSAAQISDAAIAKPTFVADKAGEYKATLEVSDGEKTDSATVTITAIAGADKEPVIDKLDPARAPAGAKATIKIIGKQFLKGAVVLFKSREVKPTSESETEIVVDLDLLLVAPGKYPVVVKNPNTRQSKPVELEVFEVPAPVITKLTPEKAGTGSKPTIKVTGANFVQGSIVFFTGTQLKTKTIGPAELEAELDLTGISIGTYPVRVRNPGGKDSNIVNFEVTIPPPPPEITIINPEQGKEGTQIDFTVYGKRFNQGSSILLDGKPIPTKFVSVGELKADPKLDLTNVPGGIRKISVRDNSGYKSKEVDFKVLGQFPIANIKTVSPNSGVTQSLALVTITGTDIDPKAKVVFNSKPAKTTTYLSPTQIRAQIDLQTTPPGSYQIWVENPGKTAPTPSNKLPFTVRPLPPPSITGVVWNNYFYKGTKGTIEVTGQGFTPNMTVEISNRGTRSTSTSYCNTRYLPTSTFTIKTPLTFISSTKFQSTFVAPTSGTSSSNSYFAVRVSRGGVASGFRCFYITPTTSPIPTPLIRTLSPVAVNLGTPSPVKVTLSGSYLDRFSIVYFNKKQIKTATYRNTSSYDAFFDISGLSAGSYDVQFEVPSGLKSTIQKFTILKKGQPQLQSVTPNSSIYAGQPYTLTLRGTGFVTGAKVHADGQPITGSVGFVNSSQITVSGTIFKSTKPKAFAITVVNPNGLKSNPYAVNVILYPAPQISSFSVRSFEEGSTSGLFYVYGQNFRSGTGLGVVTSAGKFSACSYSGSTRLTCNAVDFSGMKQGSQTVQVKNPDGQLSNQYTITITKPNPPTLSSISPTSALNNQTISLVLSGSRLSKGTLIVFGSKTFPVTTYTSSSRVTAKIDLNGIPQGIIQVKARNVVSGRNIDSNGSNFIVLEPPTPAISYFSPMRGEFGKTVNVTFTGTGFNTGTVVTMNGIKQKVNSVTPTQLVAALDLTALKKGAYSIVLDNGPTRKSAQVHFFADDPPGPTVREVRPAGVIQSLTSNTITVYGTNFHPKAVVSIKGTTIAATLTSTTARFSVPFPSQLYPANSKLEVRVRNPNGSSAAGYIYVMSPTSPLINYVNPSSSMINRTITLDIYGVTNLSGVLLFMDGQQKSYSYRGSYIRVSSYAVGNQPRNVEIKVQRSGKFSNPYFFRVAPDSAPLFSYVQPPFGKRGSTVNLTLRGNFFKTSPIATVRIDGRDFKASTTSSSSALTVTVPLTTFSAGPKTIQVLNPDKQTSQILYFTVLP